MMMWYCVRKSEGWDKLILTFNIYILNFDRLFRAISVMCIKPNSSPPNWMWLSRLVAWLYPMNRSVNFCRRDVFSSNMIIRILSNLLVSVFKNNPLWLLWNWCQVGSNCFCLIWNYLVNRFSLLGGSLLNYLRKNSNNLTTRQQMGMCRDAAAGKWNKRENFNRFSRLRCILSLC